MQLADRRCVFPAKQKKVMFALNLFWPWRPSFRKQRTKKKKKKEDINTVLLVVFTKLATQQKQAAPYLLYYLLIIPTTHFDFFDLPISCFFSYKTSPAYFLPPPSSTLYMFARRYMPGGAHYRHGRGGGGRGNLGVMLLVVDIMRIGLEHIPPVTLGVVALCTSLYLGIIPFMQGLDNDNACFNFMTLAAVLGWGSSGSGSGGAGSGLLGGFLSGLFGGGLRHVSLPSLGTMTRKLALSNFFHANDFHLYFNMMSWLYKGRNYELVYGSEFMLLWLIAAVIGVSLMYCAICSFLVLVGIPALHQQVWLFGGDGFGATLLSWLEPDACVVGFSSVIFCLKTVLNYYNVQAHGEIDEQIFIPFFGPLFATPLRYAVWAELLVCQLFTPQVSFLGHLAGIATGVVFIAIDLTGWLQPIAGTLKDLRMGRIPAPAPPRNPNNPHNYRDENTARRRQEPPQFGGGNDRNPFYPPPGGEPLHMPRGERGGFG